VLRVSDENFLREIRFASNVSTDIQVRSTRFTRSRLGLLQTWQGGALQAEATAYQDLIDPQRFSLDRLPRIAAEHGIPLLGGLAVARAPAEAVNFQREEGYDGFRFDLAPELFVPFRLNRYPFGSLRGQVRETAYQLTNEEQIAVVIPTEGAWSGVSPDRTPDQEQLHARGGACERISTRATPVSSRRSKAGWGPNSRAYPFRFLGLDRIRHSIEPEVQYLFVPRTTPTRSTMSRCGNVST
jgi:hypothetical protein